MNPRCVIIGEAWGRREAMFGHAFLGAAGRELALMLAEVRLAPHLPLQRPSELDMISHWQNVKENYGIVLDNVFSERPPGNDIELFFGKDGDRGLPPLKPGKYVQSSYRHHVEKMWDRVKAISPNLIIAFGNTACWATLGQTKIGALRGTLHLSARLGPKVLPTYHPAAILRNWSLRTIVKADLTKASREIEFPEIRRPERWITTHDHVSGERLTLPEIATWLAHKSGTSYAVDIESGYALFSKLELEKMTPQMRNILSNQISMVGFATSPSRALVVPFMDRSAPGLNYWPCVADEVAAWKHVIDALKSPLPKIFQNGNYDIGRFLAMGIVPNACEKDTMLKHHSLYPELLKSLGFLGSIYANEVSWKQMYTKRESLKRDE